MTAALRTAAGVRASFEFGLAVERYDRHDLAAAELATLREMGPAGLRRSRARGAADRAPLWTELGRLVRPLDDARALLHHPTHARYRRASAHAAGLVLQHSADTSQAFWAWTAADWAQLCGGSAEQFRAARLTPTEDTVRPFLVAIGYLLGRFDEFHLLGTFNRLHLAQLVFGAAAVEEAVRRAGEVLDGWATAACSPRSIARAGCSARRC